MTPFYIGIGSQDDDKYKRAYFRHNRVVLEYRKENSYEVEVFFF
jgi:hypothetical protein